MSKDIGMSEAERAEATGEKVAYSDPSANGVSSVQFSKDELFLDIARTLISYLVTDPLRDEVVGVRENVEFVCKKVGKSAVRIDWRRFTPPASE